MMRLFLLLFGCLLTLFLYLQSSQVGVGDELPAFLRSDEIAASHDTDVSVHVESVHQPSSEQLDNFIADYKNIWAHLNHLYATNDIEAGKAYYSEDWFRQLNRQYDGVRSGQLERTDLQHHIDILNWSIDGLVCTIMDQNVLLQYRYTNEITKTTTANIAMVLLFQGDHWRVDAIRILNEIEFVNP